MSVDLFNAGVHDGLYKSEMQMFANALANARDGEFNKLFLRYRDKVSFAANDLCGSSDVADSTTRSSFLTLWDMRGTLGKYQAPGAIMQLMGKLLAQDFLKLCELHERSAHKTSLWHGDTLNSNADEKFNAQKLRKWAMDLISDLPICEVEVFRLRLFGRLSYEKIGRNLGIESYIAQEHYRVCVEHFVERCNVPTRSELDKDDIKFIKGLSL